LGPDKGRAMTLEVTPRNAYFANSCPQRVQLDVLRPCEPLPPSAFLEMLFEAGDEYEDETVAGLFDEVEGMVVIEDADAGTRERETLRAFAEGARVVAGGRLPVDEAAHRVGEPDLLVRHGDGYVPVDVKSHKSLAAAKEPGAGTALVSDLGTPFPEHAAADADHDPRRHLADLLQLAHYRRLLESAGLASSAANVAGIYGTEGVIVWHDLDRLWLNPSEYLEHAPAGPLSAMERYDLDFAHRLEVHVAAESHVADGSVPLLAEPIACDQCPQCRWRDWCGERLEEVADVSLLSGVRPARRRLYRRHSVGDLHDLAALDWTTAELSGHDVDLLDLVARADGLAPSTPLAAVVPNRPTQLGMLAAHGIVTVSDLDALDRRTLDLGAAGATGLAKHIELARARTGAAPAYRTRGVAHAHIAVPRADVEVDVDMESTNDGCYLWGALVTDRRASPPTSDYVAFASWDHDLAAGQLVAFAAFWTWFTERRAHVRADGASFRAYCYHRGAEEGQMRPIAEILGLADEVDEFLASDEWVDLLEVVRAHLVTGRGMGLKQIAPLSGFAWSADGVGGTQAMVTYDVAVDESDPAAQAEAQGWLLRYNKDDVRATAAVRDWLDGPAGELPSIAEWHSARPAGP
jgi:predicted RecB family nuclease